MYERFTDLARQVMQAARQQAQGFNQQCIKTEHLLFCITHQAPSQIINALMNLGIDPKKIQLEIAKYMELGSHKKTSDTLPHSPEIEKAIAYAIEQTDNFNCHYVGVPHLFLGMLCEKNGAAGKILRELGISLDEMSRELHLLLGRDSLTEKQPYQYWWFKNVKRFKGNVIRYDGRLIVEAATEKQADAKLFAIFKQWPAEEDESFCYLGQVLHGPYKTQQKAADATVVD